MCKCIWIRCKILNLGAFANKCGGSNQFFTSLGTKNRIKKKIQNWMMISYGNKLFIWVLFLWIRNIQCIANSVVRFLNKWFLRVCNTANMVWFPNEWLLWVRYFFMNQKHTVQPVWSNSWTNDYYEWIGLSKSKLYCENNVVWFLNKWFLLAVSFFVNQNHTVQPVYSDSQTNYSYEPFFLQNQNHTVQPV